MRGFGSLLTFQYINGTENYEFIYQPHKHSPLSYDNQLGYQYF